MRSRQNIKTNVVRHTTSQLLEVNFHQQSRKKFQYVSQGESEDEKRLSGCLQSADVTEPSRRLTRANGLANPIRRESTEENGECACANTVKENKGERVGEKRNFCSHFVYILQLRNFGTNTYVWRCTGECQSRLCKPSQI